MNRLTAMLLATATATAGVTSAGLPGISQHLSAQERGSKVVAGRPARVFVFAGFDDACKSLKGVSIEVTQAPAHGQVQLREGQETTIMSSASGKCIGTRQTGTGIYYIATTGAVGTDTFSVSARIGSGPPVTRTFKVAIAND